MLGRGVDRSEMPGNARRSDVILVAALLILFGSNVGARAASAGYPARIDPLLRVVDLNVGESQRFTLSDGSSVQVELVNLKETLDDLRHAVRKAEVTVKIDGHEATLVSATCNLPRTVGPAQVDCSITKGYNTRGSASSWGLDKDARLRLWPKGSPWVHPGTFGYPVKQRWFATDTQMANTPVFVDGGELVASARNIYYHNDLDIGGAEGLIEVVSATDALVVSSGGETLPEHRRERDTPVSPRYDVVYLLDGRGWYYRYSHLKEIDPAIKIGARVKLGDRIGLLGKEGGSGGWSHLHFGPKSRQPSGKWGSQEAYAFIWQAWLKEHDPKLIAVARPQHFIWAGDSATLDGSKSWARSGKIASFEWTFGDGSKAAGSKVARRYERAGRYSEVLKITDDQGNIDYDFAVVQVLDRELKDRSRLSIHAAFSPTMGIQAGDPVTFKVRTFGTTAGREKWNFGDGSPIVHSRSDGNVTKLAPDGYATLSHRFEKPGHYLVHVERTNERGIRAETRLHIVVD